MRGVGCGSMVKVVLLAGAGALGLATAPQAADAQGRGTLQAVATVVDTRPAAAALRAVQAVVQNPAKSATVATVATVAQVSVDRPLARPGTLVVTVAYSRS